MSNACLRRCFGKPSFERLTCYVLDVARKISIHDPLEIILRHLLPNMVGPLTVQASFNMAGVIIAESSLSFLGLGAPPGTPSWGALLDQGKDFLIEAPHIAIFPGIAIMLTVLGFNLLGEGLRDKFDPKR